MPPADQRETSSTDSTDIVSGPPVDRSKMHPRIRIALWCGIIATPLSLANLASILIRSAIPDTGFLRWVPVGLTHLAPVLVVIGALALARESGLLPGTHTFLTALASTIALVLNAAAQASWSAGFEAANAGDPAPALARLFLPLFLASCAVGATAAAIALDGLIGKRLHPAARTAIGIGAGLVMAPVVGVTFAMTPFTVAGASVALVALTTFYRPRRSPRPAARPAPASAAPGGPTASAPAPPRAPQTAGRPRTIAGTRPARLRLVRLLGACAAALGLVAFGCVLKDLIATSGEGSHLLAVGMQIGSVALLPLFAAIGLYFSEHSPYAPAHTWGPVVLAGLAAAGAAVAFGEMPFLDRFTPAAAAVCGGAAIAWVIIRRTPLPVAPRTAVGVIAGPACAALAMPVFPAVVIAPLVGGLMIASLRAPRPAHAAAPVRP